MNAHLKRLTLAMVGLVAFAASLTAQPIRLAELDPTRVVELPVSRDITTVMFPGPITAVAGADMVIDTGKANVELDEDAPVRFHASHAPGANFILLRALQPDTTGRHTAIYEGSAYVLQLRSVATDSVASLIFNQAVASKAKHVTAPPDPVRFTPRIGLSLLDRARAYPVLVKSLPKAVEGVTRHAPNRKTVLPDLEITTEEVYRFSKEDAVVFLLKLHNPTTSVVDVVPSTFAARVSQERFEQAIANGPRSLAPGETADAEFAIVGLPDGTRNDLSLENAFTILVNSARRENTPAPAPALAEAANPEAEGVHP